MVSRWRHVAIEQYHDWLIHSLPLTSRATPPISQHGLRRYMRDMLKRYFVEWDADGILIDMLNPQGRRAEPGTDPLCVLRHRAVAAGPPPGRSSACAPTPSSRAPGTPLLARPYAHTWRYADDA